jgi:hypothetical protein
MKKNQRKSQPKKPKNKAKQTQKHHIIPLCLILTLTISTTATQTYYASILHPINYHPESSTQPQNYKFSHVWKNSDRSVAIQHGPSPKI